MILTSNEIAGSVEAGEIVIDPFCRDQLGTVSYRFRLGHGLRIIKGPVDSRQPTQYEECTLDETGFTFQPQALYLASTLEVLGSDCFAQQIFGLRDTGSMGVFLNISANFGHVGTHTKWTLEITVARPVVLYPGQLIGQIVFWRVQGNIRKYDGKYQHMERPVPSEMWREDEET